MKKLTAPLRKIPTWRDVLNISTIPEMLEYSVNKYGNNTAYSTPKNKAVYKISYSQVLDTIKRFARYLRESGFEKGDHIAILGQNRPEWGVSFFTVSWIGAVCIPLDARASLADYKFILNFSSVKAIIVSSSHYEAIKSIAHELSGLKEIILMDSIEEISNTYSSGVEMARIESDDLLEILFTSGTTGDPKGVMLSHGNIMSNVSDIHRIIGYGEQDTAFSILPIHHSYECTGGLIAMFSGGVKVFYARSLKPREMLQDLKTAKPTMWLNTPLILERLYLRIEKELSSQKGLKRLVANVLPKKVLGKRIKQRLGLENTRLIISGGAALPAWVSSGFKSYGLNVVQGYGLSETSPLVSVNPPDNPKFDSVGMIIPSDEVEIRDIDHEGNGEIVVRGPNVMKGYYKNKTATDDTFTSDGWFLTGDIGYFDEDSYLYITGRKKHVIVTKGGKNIHPEEIEEKLTKSIYIEEALVFSPDDVNIQALICPNTDEVNAKLDGMDIDHKPEEVWEIIKLEVRKTNQLLEHYKRIRHFAIRFQELPKTTTNKTKRYLFKDLNLTTDIKFHN